MRYKELFEGRDAPLYHGTGIYNACSIIKYNQIQDRTGHSAGKLLMSSFNNSKISGVSLTRDLKTALDFGKCVFVLDQRKLSQTNRLVPVEYWQIHHKEEILTRSHENKSGINDYESEEFCIGPIKNLNRCLLNILIKKENVELIDEFYDHEKDEKAVEHFSGQKRKKPLINYIKNHPLLKII